LPSDSPSAVTDLLSRWRNGDRQALDALMPIVYQELRRIARHYLQQERPDHTLQSTALVHEAYVRLLGNDPPEWQNRAHFFGVAARLMRQVLVDHARSRSADKRGGGAYKLALDEELVSARGRDLDLLDLDNALQNLALTRNRARLLNCGFLPAYPLKTLRKSWESLPPQ